MTSKINPGKFNCYTAAMPDEPIFTILGRDPAFPATVLFWRDERARQGKNVSDDDIDRLVTALGEAAGAASWRVQNLEGPDGRPTWQTRMSFVTDDTNPICIDKDSTPRYLNQDEVISDMRELLDKFENGVIYNDYDRTVELLGTLQTVVKDMERPVETNTFNEDTESGSSLMDIPLSPGGTVGRHNRASYDRPVRDRTRSIQTQDKADPTSPSGFVTVPVPVVGMEFMNEDDLTPGEKLVINSEPEDLAHNPEVPQHRFAMFNKGEHYAYARGLEINPSFLPVALDAMHKDGWELVSLFGQTNSEHVGFVFKRIVPPAMIVNTLDIRSHMERAEVDTILDDYMTMAPTFEGRPLRPENYRKGDNPYDHGKAPVLPKIEVHLEGMSDVDALSTMAVIECRMRWLPMDYETIHIVGLIANEPEAAFDMLQTRGAIHKQKTLIRDDSGCTEFGRQLEG